MDGVNRLLGRGILRFDMRDPDKFVLRLPTTQGTVAAKSKDSAVAEKDLADGEGLVLFPAVHLVSPSRDIARRRCQYCVHLSFRTFIWMMKSLGVLSYEIPGREKLDHAGANLIVANHPSLIDIVFIVRMLPEALCVVAL